MHRAPDTTQGIGRGWSLDMCPETVRYEDPNFFLDFPAPSDALPQKVHLASTYPLPPLSTEAILLSNILSPEECNSIVRSTAPHTEKNQKCITNNLRSVSRAVFESDSLSAALWSRIKSFFPPIHVSASTPSHHGHTTPLMQGTWIPIGLNPTFRTIQYHDGDYFGPHFDDYFQQGPRHLSLKTVNLYLVNSTNFSGGETHLLSPNTDFSGSSPDAHKTEFSVSAVTGGALIFNHKIPHEGGLVKQGEKWLLRTDIMYYQISRAEDQDMEFDWIIEHPTTPTCPKSQLTAQQFCLSVVAFYVSPSTGEKILFNPHDQGDITFNLEDEDYPIAWTKAIQQFNFRSVGQRALLTVRNQSWAWGNKFVCPCSPPQCPITFDISILNSYEVQQV